jgi:hypothetical protein
MAEGLGFGVHLVGLNAGDIALVLGDGADNDLAEAVQGTCACVRFGIESSGTYAHNVGDHLVYRGEGSGRVCDERSRHRA